MPYCRNCKTRISKFDKDICPICGCQHPLEGEGAVSSDTIEITTTIGAITDDIKPAIARKKNKTLLYFTLFGWTGLAFKYLRFKLSFVLCWLLINLAIIGGVGAIFAFLTPVSYFGFLISLAISYLINIIIGLVYRFKSNMKDAVGELIL